MIANIKKRKKKKKKENAHVQKCDLSLKDENNLQNVHFVFRKY